MARTKSLPHHCGYCDRHVKMEFIGTVEGLEVVVNAILFSLVVTCIDSVLISAALVGDGFNNILESRNIITNNETRINLTLIKFALRYDFEI